MKKPSWPFGWIRQILEQQERENPEPLLLQVGGMRRSQVQGRGQNFPQQDEEKKSRFLGRKDLGMGTRAQRRGRGRNSCRCHSGEPARSTAAVGVTQAGRADAGTISPISAWKPSRCRAWCGLWGLTPADPPPSPLSWLRAPGFVGCQLEATCKSYRPPTVPCHRGCLQWQLSSPSQQGEPLQSAEKEPYRMEPNQGSDLPSSLPTSTR